MNKLADIELSPEGGLKGFGPLGLEGQDAESAGGIFNNTISTIVGVMTVIAFVWFVILFMTGALGIMTAGSDKAKLEGSRQKLMNGIIGIVVVVAAVFIVDLVGGFLGIENILDPGTIIDTISPAQ